MRRRLVLHIALAVVCLSARAATVCIVTDRPDAVYKLGETATFHITVEPATAVARLVYGLSLDGARGLAAGAVEVVDGKASLTGKLDAPGILRCTLLPRDKYRDKLGRRPMAAAAFDPLQIQPTAKMPDDFVEFWGAQKAKLARIPMDPHLEPVADANSEIEVFRITLANVHGSRVHGYFAKPKGDGPFPAVLTLPRAGVYGLSPGGAVDSAAQGFLAMDISVHDMPNGQPAEFHSGQAQGPPRTYATDGRDDRMTYYFYRVFLGCVRSIDYLAGRAEWDGKHMLVNGLSQGGGLALVTAGLDPRVTAAAANAPALCDHSGLAFGRACGWPGLVPRGRDGKPNPKVLAVSAYYDACNFARLYRGPAIVSVGLIDSICPATTVFSAYNVLPGPKQIDIAPLADHDQSGSYTYTARKTRWVRAQAGLEK